MEISVKRTEDGGHYLELGYVTFDLPQSAVKKLQEIIGIRLNQSEAKDSQVLQKKLQAYRQLANKLVHVDNRIVQEFALALTAEQLVTMSRLATGESLYNKLANNLSKQNRQQFEDDYRTLSKITEQNAVANMEQAVPVIKKIANKQKQAQD